MSISDEESRQNNEKSQNLEITENANFDTLDIDPSTYDGLRRLSATLEEMEEKANDSQSDDDDDEKVDEQSYDDSIKSKDESKSIEEDSILLGEEGNWNSKHDSETATRNAIVIFFLPSYLGVFLPSYLTI